MLNSITMHRFSVIGPILQTDKVLMINLEFEKIDTDGSAFRTFGFVST